MHSSEILQANALLREERVGHNWRQQDVAERLGTSVGTVKRWERGSHHPSAYFRLKLCALFGKSAEQLGLVIPRVPAVHDAAQDGALHGCEAARPWSVPYPRNPCFTGREELLSTIHRRLGALQAGTCAPMLALVGLGGMGKTQLAVEYAYRSACAYRAIFWLEAETAESLIKSLHPIAEQLQLSQRQLAEQPQLVVAVQDWLATHAGWLLIGDNVEDPAMLQQVLPPVHQGTCLLTTRHQALGPLAEAVEVPPMSSEEGVTLLLRRAKQLSLPATPAPVRQKEREGMASAASETVELVRLLEGLPLALDQAGAYLEETSCSVGEYLQVFQRQRKQVLARRGTHGGSHPASVTTTLHLSVERVEREHPAARALLWVCALVHAEAIPEELLVGGASQLGALLGEVIADPYEFNQVLAALRKASLVQRHPETQSLSVHRVVQAVLQDQMEPSEAQLWGERVISLVNAAFPSGDFETWATCERYLPHVLACIPFMTSSQRNSLDACEVLHRAGFYLMQRGRYGEAEPLLERSASLAEQQYGSDHPALIPHLERQRELFWYQGKYASAGQLWYRALALAKRHLGPTHPHIATLLNDQGVMYWSQKDFERAESSYLQALRMEEQQLGPEHLQTMITLRNLAMTYGGLGRYEQAEALYHRILATLESRLGPTHPDTGYNLHCLATLYQVQGRYGEAEVCYQQALTILESQLGPEHPRTATTLNHLATLYQNHDHNEHIVTLYQQAFARSEQRLGPEHPRTVELRKEYNCLLDRQQENRETRRT